MPSSALRGVKCTEGVRNGRVVRIEVTKVDCIRSAKKEGSWIRDVCNCSMGGGESYKYQNGTIPLSRIHADSVLPTLISHWAKNCTQSNPLWSCSFDIDDSYTTKSLIILTGGKIKVKNNPQTSFPFIIPVHLYYLSPAQRDKWMVNSSHPSTSRVRIQIAANRSPFESTSGPKRSW